MAKILSFALFAALLAAFLAFIGGRGEYAASLNKVNAWNKQRFDDFYALPPDSLDLVFIGSSHSYCTFDPLLIDGALGTFSFQMGMPLQFPDATYYTLREILNRQRPDTVVMELYWGVMSADFDMKQADTLFQVMRNDALKEDYFKNVFPAGSKIMYRLPFARFQQELLGYWNAKLTGCAERTFDVSKPGEAQAGTEYYSDRGFMHCDYVITPGKRSWANQFNGFDGAKWTFSETQKKYIGKIAELCESENMRLLFVTAPVANASMEIIKNYSAVHERVAGFAQSLGVPYLDFNAVNQKERLFTDENFRDDAHLNYSGAVIACGYMEGWIKEWTKKQTTEPATE
ncbi:MAG: hypothetical protein FWC55_04515 [Firmicutes bacterium]|nr:hypothetical protein [Bacillota bacterium]